MARKTATAPAAPVQKEIPIAQSWQALTRLINEYRDDEHMLRDMLLAEQAGPRRQLFMQKIYGRFYVLRKDRERNELAAGEWNA